MELTNEIAPLGGFRNVSDKRVDVKAVPQKRPLGVHDRRPDVAHEDIFGPLERLPSGLDQELGRVAAGSHGRACADIVFRGEPGAGRGEIR